MPAVSTERHPRMQAVAEDARVTPIELFFDLVFVFAITQVTSLMGAEPISARGIVRGLLLLSLLWWCWVGYAWLGNVLRADEGLGRLAMFGAMAAMFVVALSVPEAFDDLPGGWYGPVVIALGYLAVRLLHLTMLWLAASANDDPGLRAQLVRWAPSVVSGTTILLVASQLHGTAQTLAWAAALVADYLGTILSGASGWRLNSAAHFAERHGLIVIIALGESIVAIGLGVVHVPIAGPIVAASVLGLTLAAAIWWTYFDVVYLVAERTLRRLRGEARARLARDAYSYLHLPMIAGIVLMALGLEEVLAGVAGEGDHTIGDPLATLPLVAMYSGVAMFLLGHVAFTYRVERFVKIRRVVAAALLLVLIPVGLELRALGALALLTGVMVVLVVAETIRYAEDRERIRHEED
ncbi:MAG TPA: low temperature requirement protein A [Actinomycetota bacterium]|nr:low temperature requirement protein A [Actinomycetota bacterium]